MHRLARPHAPTPSRPHLRRGANAVEFALTFPLFLTLFVGSFQFGTYFYLRMLADESARRGCNAGAQVSEGVGDPRTFALDTMQNWAGLGGGSCVLFNCDVQYNGVAPNRVLRCRVTGNSANFWGFNLFPLTFDVTHERRMAYQSSASGS